MSCHLMFRMLNVSPGIEVGGQVIQPVVYVVVALRGRRGRLGGAGGVLYCTMQTAQFCLKNCSLLYLLLDDTLDFLILYLEIF